MAGPKVTTSHGATAFSCTGNSGVALETTTNGKTTDRLTSAICFGPMAEFRGPGANLWAREPHAYRNFGAGYNKCSHIWISHLSMFDSKEKIYAVHSLVTYQNDRNKIGHPLFQVV